MIEGPVTIFGARSLVGECLIEELLRRGKQVRAYSREVVPSHGKALQWLQIEPSGKVPAGAAETVESWVSLLPIWVLPDYLPLMERGGARRVVALSSTSRFVKEDSPDASERQLAKWLAEGEMHLRQWAEKRSLEWVILRPAMIYGRGRDRNISELARIIRRLGFFPLAGQGKGLRQPVHAEDVARACIAAMERPEAANRCYTISGGEVLPYREMIVRLFQAMGRKPRLTTVPASILRPAVALARSLPRYRHWNVAMIERINMDMAFDHDAAARDLGFLPRSFRPAPGDVLPR